MTLYEHLQNPPPRPRCQGCDTKMPDIEDLQQLLDAGWHVWGDREQVFLCPDCVIVEK